MWFRARPRLPGQGGPDHEESGPGAQFRPVGGGEDHRLGDRAAQDCVGPQRGDLDAVGGPAPDAGQCWRDGARRPDRCRRVPEQSRLLRPGRPGADRGGKLISRNERQEQGTGAASFQWLRVS